MLTRSPCQLSLKASLFRTSMAVAIHRTMAYGLCRSLSRHSVMTIPP